MNTDLNFIQMKRLSSIIYSSNINTCIDSYKSFFKEIAHLSIIKSEQTSHAIDLKQSLNLDENIFDLFHSPFEQDKVFILDTHTIRRDPFLPEYKIELYLDTNVISYIERALRNKDTLINNSIEISYLKKIILSDKVVFNFLPYLMENTLFKNIDFDIIEENLIAYNEFFYPIFSKNMHRVQTRSILQLYRDIFLKHSDILRDMYNNLYLILLCISYIELSNSKLTAYEKFKKFLIFLHYEMYQMPFHEIKLAVTLFSNKTKYKFFNKIQLNNDNLIINLENMTSDLYNLRYLEYIFHLVKFEPNITYIPTFITFDKGLQQIKHLYKIKALVYDRDGNFVRTFSENKDALLEEPFQSKFMEYFYKTPAAYRRENNNKFNALKLIEIYKEKIIELQKENKESKK